VSPIIRSSALATALIAVMSLSAPASAVDDSSFNYETTKDLLAVCAAGMDAQAQVAAAFGCRAFIEATVQYHDAISDRKKLKRLICYPKDATIAGARDIFLAWGKKNADNTKQMNELPVVGLVRSLAQAYPCR